MNCLAISAHPDDEVLGMGGTIKKHSDNGDNIFVCILSEHVSARKGKPEHTLFLKQIEQAEKILGIKDRVFFDFPNIEMNSIPQIKIVKAIEESIIKFKPEIVYTHNSGDLNIDHRVVSEATSVAIRLRERGNKDTPIIKKTLCYEVPSSTDWASPVVTGIQFNPNYFVDISKYFDKKLLALEKYEGVIREMPHPRSIEALKALATIRGAAAGFEKAEAFMVMRELEI